MNWQLWIDPLVTWALVLAGWTIVGVQARQADRRRDLRSRVDEQVERIRAIENLAFEFFTSPPTEVAAERTAARLRRELTRLQAEVSRLKQLFPGLDVSTNCNVLKQEITGGEFESASRSAYAASHPKHASISGQAEILITEFEAKFVALKWGVLARLWPFA